MIFDIKPDFVYSDANLTPATVENFKHRFAAFGDADLWLYLSPINYENLCAYGYGFRFKTAAPVAPAPVSSPQTYFRQVSWVGENRVLGICAGVIGVCQLYHTLNGQRLPVIECRPSRRGLYRQYNESKLWC
jgi:hypothetical protein